MDRTTSNAVERLKRTRIEKGLSLSKVAALAGMDKANLSRIESGKILPTLGTLRNLVNALEIPIASLFESEETSPGKIIGDHQIVIPGLPELSFLAGWNRREEIEGPAIWRVMKGDRFPDHSRLQVETSDFAPLFMKGDTLLASKSSKPVEGSVVLGCVEGILFAVQLKSVIVFGMKKTELHSVPLGKHGAKKIALMASQEYVNWTTVTELRRQLPCSPWTEDQR